MKFIVIKDNEGNIIDKRPCPENLLKNKGLLLMANNLVKGTYILEIIDDETGND